MLNLAYTITPHRVKAELRQAFWGNGQSELFAELERPITAACAVADGNSFQIAIADA